MSSLQFILEHTMSVQEMRIQVQTWLRSKGAASGPPSLSSITSSAVDD